MITVTESAKAHLDKYISNENVIFELVGEKVGCTCSEDTTLVLKIKDKPSKEATSMISSNIGDFYTTDKQAMILNDELIIDFKPNLYALELKGKHMGIITPRLMIQN